MSCQVLTGDAFTRVVRVDGALGSGCSAQLSGHIERRELLYFVGSVAVHRVPQIPVALQTEPEVSGHAEYSGQAQCRVRCHRPTSLDNFVETWKRHAEARGESRLSDPQRLEKLGL